jgi:hypothetical protein
MPCQRLSVNIPFLDLVTVVVSEDWLLEFYFALFSMMLGPCSSYSLRDIHNYVDVSICHTLHGANLPGEMIPNLPIYFLQPNLRMLAPYIVMVLLI